MPYGLSTTSEELEQRYAAMMVELRLEADKEGWGGRPIEEDRWYLDRLFAPVQYWGPGGTIECFHCQQELAVDEICQCQKVDESDEEAVWAANPGLVKSSRCRGEFYWGRRYYCQYDRSTDNMARPCSDCRRHLPYIRRLYRATKA